jgi:hypothetical protein
MLTYAAVCYIPTQVAVTHEERGQLDVSCAAFAEVARVVKIKGASDVEVKLMDELTEERMRTAEADFVSGRMLTYADVY